MTTIAKTIVATGASSGLGFEAVKQLLGQSQAYKFILGARDTKTTQAAYDSLQYDNKKHHLTILPLELSDLKSVQSFANQTLDKLASQNLDYLFLNAGIVNAANGPGPSGSKWCEAYVVNHLSQHYLTHLFREKLTASRSRIVVVSSGAIRTVTDPKTLDTFLLAKSGNEVYCESKFAQLLGAHYWRRQLDGSCKVVAVSPGLIPETGISRGSTNGFKPTMDMPDAKSVPEGAASILKAFTVDLPEDLEQIFLTSWGEFWPKDVYEPSLDQTLQDKWCLNKEEIEKDIS